MFGKQRTPTFFTVLVNNNPNCLLHTWSQLDHRPNRTWASFHCHVNHYLGVLPVPTTTLDFLRRERGQRLGRREDVRTSPWTVKDAVRSLRIPMNITVGYDWSQQIRLRFASPENSERPRSLWRPSIGQRSTASRRRGRLLGRPDRYRNSVPSTSLWHIEMVACMYRWSQNSTRSISCWVCKARRGGRKLIGFTGSCGGWLRAKCVFPLLTLLLVIVSFYISFSPSLILWLVWWYKYHKQNEDRNVKLSIFCLWIEIVINYIHI